MVKMTTKDDSLLIEFLGDTPLIRVLDFLIVFREYDYNKHDIAKNANVSWNTLDKIWTKLIKSSVIIATRKVGKSRMYKVDTENAAIKKLIELHKLLITQSLQKSVSHNNEIPNEHDVVLA